MKLNKTLENGLLLAFYLARHGQSRLQSVSTDLGLSINFLEQIARKLRVHGVVTSVRGPGGGYILNTNTTARDVLEALGYNVLNHSTAPILEAEHLNNLLETVSQHEVAILSQTITDLVGVSSTISTTTELELNENTTNT